MPAFAFPHKLALPISPLALICCEKTRRSPHHMLYTLLSFLPQCSRFCSKPVIAHHGASRAHGPQPPPLLALLSFLLSSFPFPLSDPVPMEIPRHRWCHSSLRSLREGVGGMIFGLPGLKLHPVPEVKLQVAGRSVLFLSHLTPSQKQDIGLLSHFFQLLCSLSPSDTEGDAAQSSAQWRCSSPGLHIVPSPATVPAAKVGGGGGEINRHLRLHFKSLLKISTS